MRRLLLILFLGIGTYAGGQKPSIFTFGIEAGGNYSQIELAERVETQLSITARKGHSELFIGPIVQLYASEAQTEATSAKFTGVRGGYLYNIPTTNRHFDLTFSYVFTIQGYENKWSGTHFDQASQDYISYFHESEEFFSAHTLAYGFGVNISDHFYIRTMIAAGIFFSHLKEERKYNEAPTNLIYDFRGYDDFGFCWKPSISLGYKF